jgi:hypothetical protein
MTVVVATNDTILLLIDYSSRTLPPSCLGLGYAMEINVVGLLNRVDTMALTLEARSHLSALTTEDAR